MPLKYSFVLTWDFSSVRLPTQIYDILRLIEMEFMIIQYVGGSLWEHLQVAVYFPYYYVEGFQLFYVVNKDEQFAHIE
jgi:hypothetical protein